jgi:hypothetical protein
MIDALAGLLVAFPGSANRTRCFTHILNLVVKAILRQFDVPKAKADEALDKASQALVELAGNIDTEEEAMDDGRDGDVDNVDEDEGWFDPRYGMSQEEREELDSSVGPVRLVLVKVSSKSATTNFLTQFNSYANSRMRLRTRQPFYSLAGCNCLKILQTSLAAFIPSPSE